MKFRITILLILVCTFSVFAGFGDKEPIKWRKISPAEFSVKPLGSDSNAAAVVLCDFGTIDISNRTFYTRHTRIKIMNEEGLRYASLEIPYQNRNRHDDFSQLRAKTMIMQNGKIITFHVQEGSVEDIKINDRWRKKKFTFPKAEPGAIIEYEYTIASLDFENLDTWYFQREIPTLWSELRIQVPQPFVYLVTYENNRKLEPDEQQAFVSKFQWLYETGYRRRRMELARNQDLLYATSENRFKVWAMNNRKKKIIMRNLPGLKNVSGGDAVTDFYPQVHFDLFESSGNLPRSFKRLIMTTLDDYETRGDFIMMRDNSILTGYIHYRLKTWPQFNANLLQHERFGRYLLKNQGGMRLLDSITGGSKDELSRITAIYQYVKNSFRWNGQLSMYASQDFKDFITRKTGSSAELNLLLVNLLRNAGIKADPLLIRTSDLGSPEKMYPVRNQFNHVIAAVESKDARILLDVTSPTSEIIKLSRRDIGTEGWIVREKDPGWIEIFSQEKGKEKKDQSLFNL